MLINLHGVNTTFRASLVENDPRTLAIFAKEVALTELQGAPDLKTFKDSLTNHINDCYGTDTHHFKVSIFDHTIEEEVEELTSYPEGHISIIIDAVTNGFHSFSEH